MSSSTSVTGALVTSISLVPHVARRTSGAGPGGGLRSRRRTVSLDAASLDPRERHFTSGIAPQVCERLVQLQDVDVAGAEEAQLLSLGLALRSATSARVAEMPVAAETIGICAMASSGMMSGS